jgi:thrombospondin type 3 repeat protein
MSKWLVLLLVVLSYLATAASGAVRRDRDHDGLPDRWEKRHHLSIAKKSAKGDPDRDGLRNLREYRLRTNPRRKDTDHDGLRDRAEVRRYHTNPRRKDTDHDGLRDRAEIRRYHTNPRKKDTDGDGYSDGAEVRAGTNPRDPNSHPSGAPTPTPSPPGLPGAANTGVPPGTALTPSGSLTIGTAGAVIDARDITGQVVVNAANVTIRNSRIRSNAMWVVDNNSTGLVVEDSEIINRPVSGQPNCHNGIGNSNFTVRRTEITGCENAMNIDNPGNITFVDNYVHDLDTTGPSYVWGNDPHTDGIQIGQAASNLVIRHNWIDPSPGGGVTAGIIMYTGSGTPNSSTWIEDNYIDARGASYGIYAPRSQTHDVYINRNQMYRGVGGYTACVRLGVTVAAFGENRDAGTAALIGPDNGVGGGCSN